jgi:hypothetical protein
VTSRLSPFDLALGPVAGELADLTAAAARAGLDPRVLEDFARVPEAQRLLGRLEVPSLVERQPEAAEAYLSLLFAAYRYHAAGNRVVTPAADRLETLLLHRPPAAGPEVPGDACYVQLPEHRFWGRVADDAPHEPLDGMFLAAAPPGEDVLLVAVLGLRVERGGFSQVTMRAGPGDFAAARLARREPPFAPLMEGGAAAGFHSVATPAELLTLTHLALLAARD